MANYRKAYQQQADAATNMIWQAAVTLHPATTLVKFLMKIKIPATIARKVSMFIFPSIKKLLYTPHGRGKMGQVFK